jgi:hypothetical protein
MIDMELKGFEKMDESDERSVQGGYWYYGRYYTIFKKPNGSYGRNWW